MSLSKSAIEELIDGWACTHSSHRSKNHNLIFTGGKEDSSYSPEFSGNAVKLSIGETMTPRKSQGVLRSALSGRQNRPVDDPHDEIVPIGPGEFLYFVTEEKFRLPPYVDAELFSNPIVANRGLLFFTLGHIAPGYSGVLTGTLLNMTDDTIYLQRSETTLYMMFSWAVDDPGDDVEQLKKNSYDDTVYHETHDSPNDTLPEAREAVSTHPEPGFALTSENFVTQEELYSILAVLLTLFIVILGLSRLVFPPT